MANAPEGSVRPNGVARRRNNQPSRKTATPVEPPAGKLALSVPEVAWLMGVSVNTVWNLLTEDRLPSFTIRRRRLLARSAVEQFIARGGTE